MKVTTVRFSDDLWAAITAEAEMAGVSASQFIREAALARAAAAAGARGELPFPSFAATVDQANASVSGEGDIHGALSTLSRALAGSIRSESEALRAESQQARRTATALRKKRSENQADRADERSTRPA
jgi:predicted Zn-dependent protease